MRPAKTHFEQVPVDTVMKIAKRLPEDDAGRAADIHREARNEVPSLPAEGWRAVAQQIQHEQDPKVMSLLVQKLLIELDETLYKNGNAGRSGSSC